MDEEISEEDQNSKVIELSINEFFHDNKLINVFYDNQKEEKNEKN